MSSHVVSPFEEYKKIAKSLTFIESQGLNGLQSEIKVPANISKRGVGRYINEKSLIHPSTKGSDSKHPQFQTSTQLTGSYDALDLLDQCSGNEEYLEPTLKHGSPEKQIEKISLPVLESKFLEQVSSCDLDVFYHTMKTNGRKKVGAFNDVAPRESIPTITRRESEARASGELRTKERIPVGQAQRNVKIPQLSPNDRARANTAPTSLFTVTSNNVCGNTNPPRAMTKSRSTITSDNFELQQMENKHKKWIRLQKLEMEKELRDNNLTSYMLSKNVNKTIENSKDSLPISFLFQNNMGKDAIQKGLDSMMSLLKKAILIRVEEAMFYWLKFVEECRYKDMDAASKVSSFCALYCHT
jgi:hypothetical protein